LSPSRLTQSSIISSKELGNDGICFGDKAGAVTRGAKSPRTFSELSGDYPMELHEWRARPILFPTVYFYGLHRKQPRIATGCVVWSVRGERSCRRLIHGKPLIRHLIVIVKFINITPQLICISPALHYFYRGIGITWQLCTHADTHAEFEKA